MSKGHSTMTTGDGTGDVGEPPPPPQLEMTLIEQDRAAARRVRLTNFLTVFPRFQDLSLNLYNSGSPNRAGQKAQLCGLGFFTSGDCEKFHNVTRT